MRGEGKVVALTTKQDLVKIRSRALRTKVWFKALSRVERAIVDLTIKCVEKIRSSVLAGTISAIVDKVLQFLEEGFMVRAERAGQTLMKNICALGEKWGSKACSAWNCDKCYIKFLGVNALNT